jgi:long-subunit fatty acid transport protein
MKRIIISTMAALMLLVTHPVMAKEFYIEAQIGQYDVDTVDTTSANGTVSGITFSDFKGSLDYDTDTTFGFEVGMKLNDNMRIGLSYVDASLDFEGASITGSATDGTTTINVNARVTPATATALGVQWSNDAEIIMLKAYYDFGAFSNGLTPYVGFGIGQADIDNALSDETVMSFTAGARYSISENAYIGAKVSFMEIDGPDDSLGIQYKDIDLDVFEVIIGTTF